jgi:hypothetical protein
MIPRVSVTSTLEEVTELMTETRFLTMAESDGGATAMREMRSSMFRACWTNWLEAIPRK